MSFNSDSSGWIALLGLVVSVGGIVALAFR